MKYHLLSTACGVALLAGTLPASASKEFSGVIQLDVGAGSTDSSFVSSLISDLDDPLVVEGKAKGIWPLSDTVHVQADIFAQNTDNIIKDASDESASAYGAALHLLHPFENRARLGVAGSIWNNDFLSGGDISETATYGLAAVEGQFFGTDWTLTGQAGLFSQMQCDNNCGGTLEDGTYIRGKIRYFLHDNTSLSLATTQMWGSLNDDDGFFGGKSVTSNFSQWMLEGEHRFADSPFSGTFAVSHERMEVDLFETTADTNTVWLGLRFYYDQPSLRSHDRSGAELDTPTFGNATESVASLFYGDLGDLDLPE